MTDILPEKAMYYVSVRITIPGHRDDPGKVIAQHVIRHPRRETARRRAERYARTVEQKPWYAAEVIEGKLPAFDTTASND